MTTEDKIRKQLSDNPVLLYMKGTPEDPKCGFSRNAVEALKTTGKGYAFVNVLEAPFIREKLPSVSNWPTFPQLFIGGELVGGSDVIVAMIEDGSLQPMLESAGGA
ncbi:Grx4 family monothiol glutaredoxin [Marinobacterium lutimaris]|uniref:Glutaredoxin n=1 Tax=Marinobacterium lutimaris TaxID=568106 RepID=A0A1H5YRG4_9GAMM|nr:Grx4 family monothiol glutaredoxin [Marinobacterium lutimaris]SEG26759.1 monothiol glutaredoxin [Marinobacterium lutimaris]